MDARNALQQSSDATGGVGALLQQERTQLDPLYAQAKQTMDRPIPKPQLQKSPDAPQGSQQVPLEWVAAMNIIAGLGGARSRTGATTALQAFGTGLKSVSKANYDAFTQASTQWKEANQQVLDTNKEQIDAYTAALNDKKLSVSEQMAEIQRISAEYHNDIMAQLAAGRNYDGVARTLDMMQHHTDELSEKYDAMKLQQEKLQQVIDQKTKPTLSEDAIKQAVDSWYKTGSLNGTGISTRANNPNLTAVQNLMAKEHPDFDLAAAQLKFASQKSGAAAGGRREMQTSQALGELDQLVPAARNSLAQLKNSPFPDYNSLVNSAKFKTGDPDIVEAANMVQEVANAYTAVLVRGGQRSDAAQAASDALLKTNFSSPQWNRALDVMQANSQRIMEGIKQGTASELGADSSDGISLPGSANDRAGDPLGLR